MLGAADPVRFQGTTFSYEREATWSPDGKWIEFTDYRVTPPKDPGEPDVEEKMSLWAMPLLRAMNQA